MSRSRLNGLWSLALTLAVLVRLRGVTAGFPGTYNADEPHILHLAVSFGAGTLKPYALKYPTLWPYLLFFFFGIYFLGWSGLGLRHGIDDFAALYAWDPSSFLLIARLLSAIFSIAAAFVAWRAQRRIDRSDALPWAFLLLAFSPLTVDLSHTAKPDNLMLFLSACAWLWGLRVLMESTRASHWACGAFLGLAAASQYTALPLSVILPAAHALSPRRPAKRWLWEGAAAAFLSFFLGSPYCLLEPRTFWATLHDFSAIYAGLSFSRWEMAGRILGNDLHFAGPWLLAGLAAAWGIFSLAFQRRNRRLALFLLSAPALYLLLLVSQYDGGMPRYSLAVYPGLALAAAAGLSELAAGWTSWETLLAAFLVAGPGLAASWAHARRESLPDTRDAAGSWIEAHIPAGAVILADQPHSEPRLPMENAEVEELYAKTKASGSPRSRLYAAMLRGHPGGGYRVWLLPRSAEDIFTNPSLVKLSHADTPILDVRPDLAGLRKRKIRYVMLSSYGAGPESSPELGSFFSDVRSAGRLIARFEPAPGKIVGPEISVYDLKPTSRRRLP